MAQVMTYRPNKGVVTAASTILFDGQSLDMASTRLSNWQRLLIFGIVKGSAGTIIPNAGVRVYELATAGATLASTALIATIFTDAQAEYGISLQTLASPAVYAFEAFSPGN